MSIHLPLFEMLFDKLCHILWKLFQFRDIQESVLVNPADIFLIVTNGSRKQDDIPFFVFFLDAPQICLCFCSAVAVIAASEAPGVCTNALLRSGELRRPGSRCGRTYPSAGNSPHCPQNQILHRSKEQRRLHPWNARKW